ncbi:MAG TPA: DNA polymerase I [Candidatus Saccharimonadales bacterium]|nr:DNA polymerase I [Candidatus Saccharimonadales bacterium]
MADSTPKKFAIIDGKSVFYRGYYAMPNLSTKDGVPTGGVFGFATMALEVIRRLKPDYVAVAWDKPKTNIRKRLQMYPEYKAGRKPAPPDFYEQIPVLHELLAAFGWPLYEMDDYEADDLMGTLALQASQQGIESLLITSDLDALQLIGPLTKVFALKKGLSNIDLYSPESFTAKYGIDVHQFLDLKALKGDSSDNIPGVPGIGEKTAIQLLQDYKTLDGVYENIDLIKNSVRDKLVAGRDSAYLSKKLGAIWCDAPLKLDLTAVDGHHVQPEKLLELLNKLEFRSLARQLPEVMQVAVSNHQAASGGLAGGAGAAFKPGKNTIIDTNEKAAELHLGDSDFFYIHTRCAGKHGRDPQVLIISLNGRDTYTLDLRKLNHQAIPAEFRDVRPLVGYDVKSSLQTLLELGVSELPRTGHDVLIGAFLINALRREQTLTELAQSDLGYDGSPFEDLDADEVISRAPEIIGVIHALHQQQAKDLAEMPKLPELAAKVEWPVIPVLARMEWRGIQLDGDYLKKFAVELEDSISDLEQEIYGHAGKEFNIGSPAQLADILFETLGLPTAGIKKGKTGYSTAAEMLDKLRPLHPIIDLITHYREVTKLKNTYVDTLPQQVDGHSRLHTTFALTVAQTGRLSSNDPNLQNIPVRTELGKRIRTAFVAGKGKKLVSADYSQFELRLAAAMSGDDDMVAQFNRGADIHLTTAAQIYGRQLEDVTKQQRSAAKTVNFGVLYGMSPHGLSAATGMTFEQARHFIDEYFKLRKPLIGYLDKLKEQARTEGYVETLFGRRRPMPDIKSSNFMVRSAAERAAMNMPIQGTEADLMKLAMVAVDDELTKQVPNAHQLLQIHDSILVECDEADAEKVSDILKKTMEAIDPSLSVKLQVDVSIGQNWGEL